MPGTLFVVATPIGNLEDITLRALRVLREVGVIAAEDTRRTANLLARHGITTPMTSLHEHNEARKSPAIVARLQQGENVALVSDAGTPVVSDPGAHLIRAAIDLGIRVEPIPGPSAVLAALIASGLPTEAFAFLGFPPIRSKDRKRWLDKLKHCSGTVVFFEAPHRIVSTLGEIRDTVGDVRAVIARELTKIHEELVRGPISAVLEQLISPKGEFTVVLEIGEMPENIGALSAVSDSSRRKALAALAAEHGLTANQLYQAVENAKQLVKRPT